MKSKKDSYVRLLQEGLIDFEKMDQYQGTIADIIGFKGTPEGIAAGNGLPHAKMQDNVVNILEREYLREEAEDNQMVGMGPTDELENSPADEIEKSIDDIATTGGGAEDPTVGDYDSPLEGGEPKSSVKEDIDALVESLFSDDILFENEGDNVDGIDASDDTYEDDENPAQGEPASGDDEYPTKEIPEYSADSDVSEDFNFEGLEEDLDLEGLLEDDELEDEEEAPHAEPDEDNEGGPSDEDEDNLPSLDDEDESDLEDPEVVEDDDDIDVGDLEDEQGETVPEDEEGPPAEDEEPLDIDDEVDADDDDDEDDEDVGGDEHEECNLEDDDLDNGDEAEGDELGDGDEEEDDSDDDSDEFDNADDAEGEEMGDDGDDKVTEGLEVDARLALEESIVDRLIQEMENSSDYVDESMDFDFEDDDLDY